MPWVTIAGRHIFIEDKGPFYHGSPNGNITSFRGMTFVTKSRKVAQDYAHGRVAFTGKTTPTNPRVYEVKPDFGNQLDLRVPEHLEKYRAARAKWNADHAGDVDEQLPNPNREGFLQRMTGLPSFGYAGSILDAMPEFHSIVLDEGTQGISYAIKNGEARVKIVR